jgi:asparagine synthase (glutamine-hydrolysing)
MIAEMEVPRLKACVRSWRDGPIALAVLDYSARGEAASGLPEQNGSVIAADVRLDEPEAAQIAVQAAICASDDVLLLSLLEKHGPAGLDSVLGDFAFARWDRRGQRLICGRDVFGIRPFAYAYRPRELFAFASLPKALHGSGIVPRKIDDDAVLRSIARIWRAEDDLIAGIKRLPAAHVLEISSKGLSLRRYWQPNRAILGAGQYSPESGARELRCVIEQAIRCRLPRTGEVGAHLSGGLDSSAITVLAARQLRAQGRKLHTYSFLDRQRENISFTDETEFVKAVRDQESYIEWTPIRPPALPMALRGPMDPDKMFPCGADEPEHAVCTFAEQHGIALVLSGWGGDEAATFSGNGVFAELLLRGRWRALARAIGDLSRERGMTVLTILRGEALSYVFSAVLPQRILGLIRRVMGRSADFRTRLFQSLAPSARRRIESMRQPAIGVGPNARVNSLQLVTNPHIADRAEIWAEIGAGHGIAFAFPLLDRRVVELALSLPSELFVRDGFRRKPFRDAMAGALPDSVRLRHQKYQPFPGDVLDLAESKHDLLACIDAYSNNKIICRFIDLAELRHKVEAFPPPELLCKEMSGKDNPTPDPDMLVAARILRAAEYLAQHGD